MSEALFELTQLEAKIFLAWFGETLEAPVPVLATLSYDTNLTHRRIAVSHAKIRAAVKQTMERAMLSASKNSEAFDVVKIALDTTECKIVYALLPSEQELTEMAEHDSLVRAAWLFCNDPVINCSYKEMVQAVGKLNRLLSVYVSR